MVWVDSAIRRAGSPTSGCPTGGAGATGAEGGTSLGGGSAGSHLGGLAFTGLDAHALLGLGLMVGIIGLMLLVIAQALSR